MITSADEQWPEIAWVQDDLLEEDVDERMTVYTMFGMDKAGNEYEGTRYYFHDEFDEIKDISKL